MELLTGQAKIDCVKWAKSKGFDLWKPKDYPLKVAQSVFNAIVIEWFDRIGYILEVRRYSESAGNSSLIALRNMNALLRMKTTVGLKRLFRL